MFFSNTLSQVVALRGKIPANIKDTTSVSSVPMANLVKMRDQNTKKQQVGQGLQGTDSTQRKIQVGKSNAQKNLSSHSQLEKEVELGKGVQSKIAQSKAMVAPGSLSAFRQMKTQLIEKEKRAKQTDLLQQLQPVYRASSQVLLRGSQAHSLSQPQRIVPDLQEDYVNHMGSNEDNLEQHSDEEDDYSEDFSTLTPEELGMQAEPLMNHEHESEQIGNDHYHSALNILR